MKNLERSDQLFGLVRRQGRRWAPFAALACQVSLLAASGCNSANDSGELATVSQALASDEERVLGFEDPADWAITSGSGVLASNGEASQGSASLAVPGAGYVAIRNVTPLATGSGAVPEVVGYDVFLPEVQNNPFWAGDTQLYVEAPSAGIHNQYLGIRSFEGAPRGRFTRVEFVVPEAIRQALGSGSYADLRFTLAFNVDPAHGTLYVDNLTLGPSAPSEDEFVQTGPEDDVINLGGKGAASVFSGDGADKVTGSNYDDHVEGGPGDDRLAGADGDDALVGQGGDDVLFGGPGGDRLLPGAGRDETYGDGGDDYVLVMSTCQLEAGEILDGGEGYDTLITPVPETELQALGVVVRNFERVLLTEEEAFECNPTTCECDDSFPRTERDPCDFSDMAGEPGVDAAALAQACKGFSEDASELVEILLQNPTEEAADDWFRANADLRTLQDGLFGVVTHAGEASFVPDTGPGTPLPGVDMRLNACDRPDRLLQLDVGYGGRENCSVAEQMQLYEAADHAAFLVWRMEQQVGEVLSALNAGHAAAAEEMWTRGAARYSLAWWFGDFDRDRVEAVAQTARILRDRLHGGGGDAYGRLRLQCWHSLRGWRIAALALFNPAALLFHYGTNPCGANHVLGWHTHAHAFYAQPGTGTAAGVVARYPYASLEFCPVFFDQFDHSDEELLIFQAGVILHESLHWHSNDLGLLRDRHQDSNDLCSGGCYGETVAHNLAVQLPDVAVRNIDNYESWANRVGTQYLLGYCDAARNPLCIQSDCCGNGTQEPHELCDGEVASSIDCAALSQGVGPVSCGSSCLEYDTSACIDLDDPVDRFCTEAIPPRPCQSDADCVGLGGPSDTVQDHECDPASLTCQCPLPPPIP